MTEWREVRLGDVCKSISSSYCRQDKYVILVNTSDVFNGKIINHILVENKNLKGQFKKTFQKDDILYSEIRPINKRFAYIDFYDTFNYIASTKLMVIRADKHKILPKFLYLILKKDDLINELQHLAETRSGTFPQITFSSELSKIIINLPPIKTQERIAGILSALDDKIELNNKINQNLEAQAQALFKSWFVDFEPFGRKIPDDWKYSSLINNDIFKLIKPGINFFENSKYYVATADANNTGIINNKNFITFDDRPSRANMQPTINSVWFAKMKNSQKHFVIDETWKDEVNKFILSTGFCGIQCSYNDLYYLWCFISSDDFNNQKDNLCNGTTMEAINNNSLATIQLLIPDFDNLNKFNNLVKPLFELISINKFQNQKLAEIRDALLPKLISGQIDVENFILSV